MYTCCRRTASILAHSFNRGQRRNLVISLDNGSLSNIKTILAAETQNQYAGKSLQVSGFVQTIRKQKKVVFVTVKDGSCYQTLQAVLRPDQGKDMSVGQAVELKGTLEPCPPSAQQPFELRVTDALAVGENDAESNPLQNKYQSPQFLRTIPHLRPRLPSQAVLLNLRSKVVQHMTDWFSDQNFVQIHPPLITSSDCEGAGEVFTVASNAEATPGKAQDVDHHFKTEKYLTVSAQLHLEAMAQAVDRVWCLSPTFRAEKSDTARHLSEFYMLEAELSFVNDVGQVMDVVENMIKHITTSIGGSDGLRSDLLARLGSSQPPEGEETGESTINADALQKRWVVLTTQKSWTRVSYDEAFEALQKAYESDTSIFSVVPDYKAGFHAEHERFLAGAFGNGAPIFIYNYPREQKPFYMLPDAASGSKFAACFDLIAPDVCELAGGSLREHDLASLEQTMQDKGMLSPRGATKTRREETMDWYLDLRRYGSVPHGGFGIGFDRLLCYLAGVSNVRDMVTFPRYYGHCDA